MIFGHLRSRTGLGLRKHTLRFGSLLLRPVSLANLHLKNNQVVSADLLVATWYGGSAAQSFGLNLWEVLGCQIAGWFLIATIFVLNGRAGAVYHVGFPINCRAAFGVFGGWWPTFNRAVGKRLVLREEVECIHLPGFGVNRPVPTFRLKLLACPLSCTDFDDTSKSHQQGFLSGRKQMPENISRIHPASESHLV